MYFTKDVNIQDCPNIFLKFVAWLLFALPKQLGYGEPLEFGANGIIHLDALMRKFSIYEGQRYGMFKN